MELTATPYILRLDMAKEGGCHGSLVRLPDGVEGFFNSAEGLLCLLEAMGGRRWWQTHREDVIEQCRLKDYNV